MFKDIYESAYDIRVQSDYGRKSRIVELSKVNVNKIIQEVEEIISETENELKDIGIL